MDDSQRFQKVQSSVQSTVRTKSSVPKRVTESEAIDRNNPFNTNNNANNLKMLGFGNDFLGFTPQTVPAKPVDREDLKVAQSNPYDNLDDIDFRTNPGGQGPLLGQPYPVFDAPSFGNFEKKNPKSPVQPPKTGEVNLLDL